MFNDWGKWMALSTCKCHELFSFMLAAGELHLSFFLLKKVR